MGMTCRSELMIALAILSFVLVNMAAYFMRFASNVADRHESHDRSGAGRRSPRDHSRHLSLRRDRQLRGHRSTISRFPGFSRTTSVTHVGGDTLSVVDHKMITVSAMGSEAAGAGHARSLIAKFDE